MSTEPVTRTIASTKWIGRSHLGNPTHLVAFTDGTMARTRANSQVGYTVDNYRAGDRVNVTYTSRGTIVGLDPAD